jgi:predicted dehydrogenase
MDQIPSRRILVIGVGSIGERHVRCFQRTARATVSIVETNGELRREIQARYGIEEAFEDTESALRNPFDAAVICTPANSHIPLAIQCARRGLHLLIEKPLSTTQSGMEELAGIVREKKLTAAVAYVMRAHPALAAMRREIHSGRFGQPVELVAITGQHFPTYRPAFRDIYYADRARGGGAIQDALTHVLNAGEWLVGPVTRLAADAAHQVLEGVSVEDTVHVLTRHGNVLGSYSLNQHQAPNEFTLTVVCQKGTIRFENHLHRHRWIVTPGSEWQDVSIEPLERDSLFVAQAERFLAAIEGEPPLCSLAEGEQTLRVNLAVLKAAESSTWVVP